MPWTGRRGQSVPCSCEAFEQTPETGCVESLVEEIRGAELFRETADIFADVIAVDDLYRSGSAAGAGKRSEYADAVSPL